VLGQARSTQRQVPKIRDDEAELVRRIVALAGSPWRASMADMVIDG
jgi:hypothetical protein